MLKHVIAEVSREIPRQVCAKSKISGSCLILAWHEHIKIAEARRISRKLCNMKEQCKCRTAQTWKERSKWKAEWCRNQVRSLYFIWAIAESLLLGHFEPKAGRNMSWYRAFLVPFKCPPQWWKPERKMPFGNHRVQVLSSILVHFHSCKNMQ